MPTLQNLPLELIEAIASNLEQRDLNAFIRTNRRFHLFLNCYLYRHNKDYYGGSALLWGAQHGQIKTVQYAIQQGVDLEIKEQPGPGGWLGLTPVEIAARERHYAITSLLIENGAKTHGSTVLSSTLMTSCQSFIRGEDATQNKNAWEPLKAAAQMGHDELVDLVVTGKVDDDQFYSPIRSTLVEAVRACETNLSIARLLLREEVEKNSVSSVKLYAALAGCCDAMVKLLLEEESFSKMNSPIYPDGLARAAAFGQIPMMSLLLDHGSNPNRRDWGARRTPLMWAAYSGQLEAVKLLLEKGADPNLKSVNGETAMSLARKGLSRWESEDLLWYKNRKGKKDVVKYLRRQGVKSEGGFHAWKFW